MGYGLSLIQSDIESNFLRNKNAMKESCLVIFIFLSFSIVQAEAYQTVRVDGRQLLADFDQHGTYQPFLIKGMAHSSASTRSG